MDLQSVSECKSSANQMLTLCHLTDFEKTCQLRKLQSGSIGFAQGMIWEQRSYYTTFCLLRELPTLIIPYLSTLPTLIK